jgi:LPXTG-motif cell wall-anchored protein
MRRLTGFLVLVLSLMVATDAAAKEMVGAKVCGPSDCRRTENRHVLEAIMEGGPSTLPPNKAPWYRVLSKIDEGDQGFWVRSVVVPSASMIRGDDNAGGYMSWVRISPATLRVYRKLTQGIAPFPARKLRGLEPPPAKVDEVVLPPHPHSIAAAKDDDGTSPLPWVGGGIALLAAGGLVLVRRRR